MSEVKTDSVVNVSGDNDSGIDLSTNDVVAIKTADSERVRVASDGKVGIGTTSPARDLHVSGGTDTRIRTEESGGSMIDLTVTNSGHFIDSTSTGDLTVNKIGSANMIFKTANTERLRIDGSSRMMFNTGGSAITAGGGTPQLSMNFSASVGPGLTIQDTAPVNGNAFVRFVNAGTYAGQISSNGGTSMTYGSASDHRLKENVEDMTGAITRVKSLQPRRFSWIADDLDAPNFDGFLAHEAQAVVPEAVIGTHNQVDDDGNAMMQSIDQAKLVPLLVGALKESIAKIEALETEMTALKARVTALEDA